jgi:cullin 4
VMPKDTSTSTQASSENSTLPPNLKKRKRVADSSDPSQPSIQNLFTSSNKKSTAQSANQSKPSSTAALKRAHFAFTDPTNPLPLPSSKMYHFPSTQKKPLDVIDLTNTPSPSPTPHERTPTRKLAMPSIVAPQLGAKRLVVKNKRPSKANPTQYFEQTSKKLDRALDLILDDGNTSSLSMEDLYQGVKNVCKQGYAAELSARLTARMKAHAVQVVKPGISKMISRNPRGDVALTWIINQWRQWNEHWATIRSIYFYMDIPPQTPLKDMTINLFLQGVIADPTIRDRTLHFTTDIISQARHGLDFDADLCQSAIQLFIDLGLYSDVLEPLILSESQSYVAEWAAERSAEGDLRDYLKSVTGLFDSELLRADQLLLSSTTKRSLLTILENGAIRACENRLTDENDVGDLLDDDSEADLADLYTLLGRCKLSNKLIKPFEKWIKNVGTGIVFDDKHEDEMVVRCLSLYKQIDRIYINAFQRNKDFAYALRDAFEEIMNKTKKSSATHNTDNTKQGEMIAKYVDLLLRGGHRAIPTSVAKAYAPQHNAEEEDNEVDEQDTIMNDQLDQVLDLFRFLHGKAVFEAFYKKDLARRLLMGRSASADAELSMLTRLKNECGEGFTHNLEVMFKDIELSKEEIAEHKNRVAEPDSRPSVDLSVMILSKAAWPSYPDIKVNIPLDVQNALKKFETSYEIHHNNRVLEWKHGLAHCQLTAQFPRGPKKELIVSGFQAVVLLLFNSEEVLSYERILAETGLRKFLLSISLSLHIDSFCS